MDTLRGCGWELRRYTSGDARTWDDFNAASRNGTFLFARGYMDYHADRFCDCSLMAYLRGRLLALLPAEVSGEGVLRSHGGLTYGGWILPPSHLDAGNVLDLFMALTLWCRDEGFKAIDYKPVPSIYARRPSEDDLYALFRLGARQTACGVSSTIDLRNPGGLNTLQRRHLRKALALNPVIEETDDTAAFHRMLSECLSERHGTMPVHTAAELELLRGRFPENIRLFTASIDGEPVAGTCMYLTDTVAHTQYIATTPRGRELNMLTPLFDYLITRFRASRRWFDFGISTEEGGAVLNRGLLRQKTSYGASATVYQRFMIEL